MNSARPSPDSAPPPISLLSQPRDAAAYAAHLETCRQTAIDLGELVKRLSALARIGQSPQPATSEPIDLESLLDERIQSFMAAFEKRGLRISRVRSTTPQIAIGDMTLVRIVLNNLLDNAACHAPSGSEIVIRTGQLAREGGSVRFQSHRQAAGQSRAPVRAAFPSGILAR